MTNCADPLTPEEWLACNFSHTMSPQIKHEVYKIKGNDYQLKKLLVIDPFTPFHI